MYEDLHAALDADWVAWGRFVRGADPALVFSVTEHRKRDGQHGPISRVV
ncbi:hypothetical protein SF83666_c14830 [Sinorhizobium fredii CCBAU 83666]|nr:hypothetical protein SF83666_c14830 [Sinorhizobium fredii CCBAU 83666]